MLKIHQVFIAKFLLLFIGALLISSIISYTTLKSIIIGNYTTHLQNSIKLLSIELSRIDNLDKYAQKISEETNMRLTIINGKGLVMAESNADKTTMENHSSRYEIMQADNKEFSHVIRHSETLNVDFLYVVKKISYNSEIIYVRLAISLAQIMNDFYLLWIKLFFVFFFISLLALYASKKMSERIVYDIVQITKYLDEISNKNYKATIKTKYFYEFLQISLLLKNLVKKLHHRDKQKRKYTAKQRLINRQRNDILSAISHEFKNPVAAIMGYAQTLRQDPNLDMKIRDKFLEKINSNGDKIAKMLDRLALTVKLENSDIEIKETTFNLKLLCEEVIANLSSKYKSREITIEGEDYIVHGDKTMLELALINLMDNALKYSEDNVEVILKNYTLYVKDSGIGIKEKYLDKVTSKFYRVEKNSWDNSMGIGLAMVSYILKAHKTALEIKSVYSEGSVFSFKVENLLNKERYN
ncbi:MAG: ATP-binding protein [Campylobacterales bacterium]|nr:ATP-binding protein [Campylobacterales bacterium]